MTGCLQQLHAHPAYPEYFIIDTDMTADPGEALLQFFQQVALRQPEYLQTLRDQPGFTIDTRSWTFTLPELFIFMQQRIDAFKALEYKEFRKILFSTPVNESIQQYGSQVIIMNNQHNVDQSEYALVWQEKHHDRS